MGYSRDELESAAGRTVPDLVGPATRLLVVGINPGLWTAATGTHFARPGNRFWPAMRRAGVVAWDFDHTVPLDDATRERLLDSGLGITNLVPRASARADELTDEELREAPARLAHLVGTVRPRVVAVAGVTAYRVAFGRRRARMGRQPEDLAGTALWVVPNPSGLNAHETVETLADAYREVGVAAGLVPPPS